MLLLLGLVLLIVVFVLMVWFDVGYEAPRAGIVVGCVILVATLIILPISRNETHVEIVAFQQVESDISIAREAALDAIERASLTKTIIKYNTWLAKQKYRNEGFWDIFIPDEILLLKKLK